MPNNQTNSNSKPDQTNPAGTAISSEISRQRQTPEPQASLAHASGVSRRERWQRQLDWAKQNLPNEHPPFVVAAIGTLKLRREKPTRESVLARLRDQGRLMSQMEQMNVNEREQTA